MITRMIFRRVETVGQVRHSKQDPFFNLEIREIECLSFSKTTWSTMNTENFEYLAREIIGGTSVLLQKKKRLSTQILSICQR